MNGYAIFEQNDPQIAILAPWNLNPAANPAIALYLPAQRGTYRRFKPLILNDSAIGAPTNHQKVLCKTHQGTLAALLASGARL